MYLENHQIIYSPSDLTHFMDSPFASWMEHLSQIHPEQTPIKDPEDAMSVLLQKKGMSHEHAILESFHKQNLILEDFGHSNDCINDTVNALQLGKDIIFQAALKEPPFKGFVDFLVRVEGASALGDYHYEVWDTKLAHSVKPYFIVQLCCYVELLENVQKRRCEHIVVVLGNGETKRLRTNDFYFYYQNLKRRFLQFHKDFNPETPPDPTDSIGFGRWATYAEELIKKSDHLVQIATITKSQIKKFQQAGINTMQQLIDKDSNHIKGIKDSVVERLRSQSILQKNSEGLNRPLYQIISDPSKKQGLSMLPPLSPGDVFFDIEGYPLEEGGLEYLWGVAYFDKNNQRLYKDFWAHDKEQEKCAFQEFIHWVYSRWLEHPLMHIYHYAAYEITACRKLMGRYGVCEFEVDQLLRNEVFVDLYKIIKSSLLLGEPRYSIKNVEHLYRNKRITEVGSGGDSIVVYGLWKEQPDGTIWQNSKILSDIREYNIDDCNSTQELVDWLRVRQKEHDIIYLGQKEILQPPINEASDERQQLRDGFLKKSDMLLEEGNEEEAHLYSFFAWVLEFHRREAKPKFWRLFDRLGLTEYELLEDCDCLALCKRTSRAPYKPTPKARNLAYEYSFDVNQEFKGGSKQNYYVLGLKRDDGKNVKVSLVAKDSDFDKGLIVLQMKDELDEMITLIPDEYIPPSPIPEAITKQAQYFAKGLLNHSAIIDFLQKQPPKIKGNFTGQPISESHDSNQRLKDIIHVVSNLENSYLTIQGPPGSGKTTTAARIIGHLLRMGKKIALSSNSNKAINHLIMCTAKFCHQEGIKAYFACTEDNDPALQELEVDILKKEEICNKVTSSCVIGTTAWGLARDDLENSFDYLFIDEAGQVSVANLIAMSLSAKNIILMGDQMQLSQPSQGNHPENSGLSILDYLLDDTPTIPNDMGIFLETTYRMHSSVNQFISHAIYEGKLVSNFENDKQIIRVPHNYEGLLNKEAGIIAVPIIHQGNTQASDEEVEEIVKLAEQLMGRVFIPKDGLERMIGWSDILFMAPYNYQVNKIKSALGDKARVGSVDKFQGQEAPVVFLSMCASDANESPRGLDFLLNKNRINVAISRAQSMAVVVYSPYLLECMGSNMKQIAQMNIFCKLLKS